MAENLTLNVPQGFDTDAFLEQLASGYRAEGFTVNVVNLYGAKKIQLKKDCDGIKNFVGLGQGIDVNCSLNNGVLNLSYSNANWTFKIVSLVIGLFLGLCLIGIPFLICSVVGIMKQINLPKKITERATMMVGQACQNAAPYGNQDMRF